ncbi:MAG: methylenetetrahydrofolate reductase C-terminal domain-containing protein [Victivallaceae bacterium]|nr:methylenetetrahydrofolate reductase C-terminal domain-containing protein [Victivallaceae bacterium]
MDDIQLEINLTPPKRNRFREAVERGEFVMLVEHSSPGKANPPEACAERLAALEKCVLDISSVNTALAITDRGFTIDAWRAVEYAAALSPENRDRHLVYISGRDTAPEEVRNLISIAANNGNLNVVATTGSALPGDGVRETRRRSFTESVNILEMIGERPANNFFTGGVVNPFQYTPFTLLGQYGKLARKYLAGASFAVTQAGWDMLKLQSLFWYQMGRGVYNPMIARLILLTPERVEQILNGGMPGVNISPDFRKILDKELRYSVNQFESAQLRRLELQAAGCRLLGFSGIQLAGVDQPHRVKVVAERIGAALREFTSFGHWLEEYNSYLARTEMAPFSSSFYLYDRTLHRPYPTEAPPTANEVGSLCVTPLEKLKFNLRRALFERSSRRPGGSTLGKKLLSHCRGCQRCRLADTWFVCTENCPKRLANGPCGGVRPDGECELQNFECIHSRIARLAHWRGEIARVDEKLLPPGR